MSGIVFLNLSKEEFLSKNVLHKYTGLEFALKTLDTKQLWFSNPTQWKDPFEKRFIEASYEKDNKFVEFPWKDKVYCICFTQTTVSEAHWTTYSSQQIGIEFRLRRKTLLEELNRITSMYDVYIGKVEYMKTADIKKRLSQIPFIAPIPKMYSNEWYARLLLLKRVAYKYEDEIRIILVRKSKTNDVKTKIGYDFEYTCSNKDLIHTILIGPQVPDRITTLLKKVFSETYGFKDSEANGKIRRRVLKSQLYTDVKPQKLKL